MWELDDSGGGVNTGTSLAVSASFDDAVFLSPRGVFSDILRQMLKLSVSFLKRSCKFKYLN